MASDQYLAEIRLFPFNFAPYGWAACNGQVISISSNTALFSLLGTYYGGDGKSTFGLPNLMGSAAMHQGQGNGLSSRSLGEKGGEPSVTLLQTQMPSHNHVVNASNSGGSTSNPQNLVWGVPGAGRGLVWYTPTGGGSTSLGPAALTLTGSGLPHNNLMPYLTLNYCIALQGIFPPRG